MLPPWAPGVKIFGLEVPPNIGQMKVNKTKKNIFEKYLAWSLHSQKR